MSKNIRRFPLRFLFSIALICFLFSALFHYLSQPGALTPISTSTPRVTVSPTATASQYDLESWVKYFAAQNTPKDVTITNVLCLKYDDTSSNITILCTMDVMYSDKHYLRAASNLIHGFLDDISCRDDVRNVTLSFYGPFIDFYGNEVTDTGIRVEYSMQTIKKINFDYFESKLYSDPDSIIKVADNYYIHPAYQD